MVRANNGYTMLLPDRDKVEIFERSYKIFEEMDEDPRR